MNSARQAEWVFGQGPDSPFVDWSAIQGLFGTAKSDVLILLDTCAAASSATTSQFAVMETIAACGFERIAPPPGQHSMTNTLIDVLHDWINKPFFSAASLHTELLFRLKLKEKKKGREGIPLEWCVTPVHWINAKDCKPTGIEICRRNILPLPSTISEASSSEEDSSTFVDAMDIDFDDANSSSTPLSSLSSTGTYKVPHVMITLQLEESQPLDTEQTTRWLARFPLLAKWVKVEAVFPSYSTLIIMSMPLPIWDMLPDHPACSFIAYVTGPNLDGMFRREEYGISKEHQELSKMKNPLTIATTSTTNIAGADDGKTTEIEEILRECSTLHVDKFALIVLEENGDQRVYSSHSLEKYQDRIFTPKVKGEFIRFAGRGIEGNLRWPNLREYLRKATILIDLLMSLIQLLFRTWRKVWLTMTIHMKTRFQS
jgi:hypothetical protein